MQESIQDWLYPINSASRYRLGGIDEDRDDLVTRENIWESIFSDPNQIADWHLSSGFLQMREGDRIWILDTQAPKAIVAVATALEIYETPHGTWSVDLAWNLALTRRLKREPIFKEDFGQTAQTVNRANRRTREVLDRWLKGKQKESSKRRIKQAEEETARIRVLREIALRRGQGVFRTEMLIAYESRCAITGESSPEVLEAAHIDPYSAGGVSRVSNGVLLRADLHTLFDLHLITITERGIIRVSPDIQSGSYGEFHGRKARLPKVKAHRPNPKLLRQHSSQLMSG